MTSRAVTSRAEASRTPARSAPRARRRRSPARQSRAPCPSSAPRRAAPAAPRLLRPGLGHLEPVDHDDRALAHLLDERVTQRAPPGLLGQVERIVPRCGPNTVPPLRHSGLRISPTRARPVPFWRHGFRPLPLTMRGLGRVRAAPLAGVLVHDRRQMRSAFTRPPNTSSLRSSDRPSRSANSRCRAAINSYQLPASAPSWRLEAGSDLFLPLARLLGLRLRCAPWRHGLRTITYPPGAPGTAPSTTSRWCSASTWTTRRLRTVTRSAPSGRPPACLHEREGRRRADRTGRAIGTSSVRGGAAAEVMAPDHALETLARLVPITST